MSNERTSTDRGVTSTKDLLSVEQAARMHGVNRGSLRAAIDDGRVRCVERRPWGASERILVSEAELVEDLAKLPRCRGNGCDEIAFAASGYCGAHFGQAGREGARKHERELLNDQDRDWLTADEAAQRAGMLRAAIVEKVKRGKLAGEKVGRTWRIPKEAVEQLRKGQRGKPRRIMPTLDETARRRRQVAALHRQQLSIPEMAEQIDVDKSTIYHDLEKLALKPPGDRREARALTPEEIAELPDLYKAGRTLDELAAQFDVSPGQVRDQLKRLGVSRRAAGTRPKYPEPAERRCEKCDATFTPPSRAAWAQRFCSERCSQEAARKAWKEALKAEGLLAVEEIAERFRLSGSSIYALRTSGRLVGEEVASPTSRPVWGVREDELDQFERDWMRGDRADDGRRLRWLDEDKATKQLESMGVLASRAQKHKLTLAEVETIERMRLAERAKLLRRRRRGRKPSDRQPDHHLHWRARHEALRLELYEGWQQAKALGLEAGDSPSHWSVCVAVALEDWGENPDPGVWPPDRWPADPNDPEELDPKLERAAGNRVNMALKRLQNAAH